MNLASPRQISSTDWIQESLVANKQQPLTWYKVLILALAISQALEFHKLNVNNVKQQILLVLRFFSLYNRMQCNFCVKINLEELITIVTYRFSKQSVIV